MRSWLDISRLSRASAAPRVLPFIVEWARGGAGALGRAGVQRLQPDGRDARGRGRGLPAVRLRAVADRADPGLRRRTAVPDQRPRAAVRAHRLHAAVQHERAAGRVSINCGYTAAGLPIGLQIAGPRHDDLGGAADRARLGADAAGAAAVADTAEGLTRSRSRRGANPAAPACRADRGSPVPNPPMFPETATRQAADPAMPALDAAAQQQLIERCRRESLALLERNLTPHGILAASPHRRRRGQALHARVRRATPRSACWRCPAAAWPRSSTARSPASMRWPRSRRANGQIPKYVDPEGQRRRLLVPRLHRRHACGG